MYNYPNISDIDISKYKFSINKFICNLSSAFLINSQVQIGNYIKGKLIYTSTGSEALMPGCVAVFDLKENYTKYYTLKDILRKMQCLSAIDQEVYYILLFSCKSAASLDKKFFEEGYSFISDAKLNNARTHLLIYQLFDDSVGYLQDKVNTGDCNKLTHLVDGKSKLTDGRK
jgi:hypothetical protein